MSGSLFEDDPQDESAPDTTHADHAAALRWPNACARARSMTSSARTTSSRPARRSAKPSSATCFTRSFSGVLRAPARPRWRASSRTRPSARFVPVQRRPRRHQGHQGGDGSRGGTATHDRAPHDRLRRRDSPLQQGAAGRLPSACRGRRHRPHRRNHREPVVRGERGAAVALEGVRAVSRSPSRPWSRSCGAPLQTGSAASASTSRSATRPSRRLPASPTATRGPR